MSSHTEKANDVAGKVVSFAENGLLRLELKIATAGEWHEYNAKFTDGQLVEIDGWRTYI